MRVVDRGIVFDASSAAPERRFCTFTSLVHLSSGRLLVTFRTGSAKDSPDEDVLITASDDEGQTWHPVFTGFTDHLGSGGERVRAAGLTEIKPGNLIGAFMLVDRSDPALPFANPETQGTLPARIVVAESEEAESADLSWRPLREAVSGSEKGAITGEILVLSDGTLALPYESWKGYYDTSPGEHYAALRLSVDGGLTWSSPVVVAQDTFGRLFYWDQRLSVAPDDGRLISVLWTHDRDGQQDIPIHIAWGSPDGKNWTEPVSTGIAGQIFAPLALEGGRVFGVYVHRHDPPSLRAVLSDDFGQSWDAADELVIYRKELGKRESGMGGTRDFADYWDDMNVWTFGHPAIASLPNGDVIVAHYAGDEEAMSIHWLRIDVT